MRALLWLSIALVACTPRHPAAPPRTGYLNADPPEGAPEQPLAKPEKPGLPPLPQMTTLKGTLHGRPFLPKTALLIARNTLNGEATITISEYDATCDGGAEPGDGATMLKVTVPWKLVAERTDAKPSVAFGTRAAAGWKMVETPSPGVVVLAAPQGTGDAGRGRIKITAKAGEDAVDGEIDVIPCR